MLRKADWSKRVTKVKWSIEEAVSLFALYKKYDNYRRISDNEIEELSNTLTNRAKILGIEIDEKFRNNAGIRMQLGCIHFIVSEGAEGIRNVGNVFRDVYKLYRILPSVYESLLKDFYSKYK